MIGAEAAPATGTFEAFYRAERTNVVRLAHLLTGSASIAEELAQDALLAVHQRWTEIDNPHGFVRVALVNRAKSYHRRAFLVRRRASTQTVQHTLPPEFDDAWAAIVRLSPDHRAVVVLRFYEDLSISDIAEITGKPIGTVKSQLHRALGRLKEDLSS